MSKYAVVIRQLNGSRPVTTAVVKEVVANIDDMEDYLCCTAKDRIEEFKKLFPEFMDAVWYIDLMLGTSCTPYETVVIPPRSRGCPSLSL